jgi:hypothetical protein
MVWSLVIFSRDPREYNTVDTVRSRYCIDLLTRVFQALLTNAQDFRPRWIRVVRKLFQPCTLNLRTKAHCSRMGMTLRERVLARGAEDYSMSNYALTTFISPRSSHGIAKTKKLQVWIRPAKWDPPIRFPTLTLFPIVRRGAGLCKAGGNYIKVPYLITYLHWNKRLH